MQRTVTVQPAEFIYHLCSHQILNAGMYVQFASCRAITEYVMSKATSSITGTQFTLLLIQEKLCIINKTLAT